MIEARNIVKEVEGPGGRLRILDDIDLEVDAGRSLAIVGASGSGKTTLLGILAGLDLPSAGIVRLAGEEITAMNEDQRAAVRNQRVGFVFQSFHLLASLTARENAALPLEMRGDRNALTAADEALSQVGLSARAGHYPNQLSGGEKQRVAIARAFLTRPAILFADEPTGNLDRTTSAQVEKLLFELNAQHGTTLVMVTHDPRLADHCEQRLTLDGGRIVTAAAPA